MLNITSERKITISKDILENSKKVAALVEDKNLKKKVYASMIAVSSFVKEMRQYGIYTDVRDSLTRVASFSELLDLGNVMFQSKIQIDVRVVIDGDNIFIPKSHIKQEIIPDIYVGARLNKNFNYIEFLGFIETDKLRFLEDLKEYYSVPVSELKPLSQLEDVLKHVTPSHKIFDSYMHNKIQDLLTQGYKVCFIIVSLNPYVSEIKIDKKTKFFDYFQECIEKGMTVKGYTCNLVGDNLKINKAIEINI